MAAQGGATALGRHPCHKLVGCLSAARLGGSAEAPPPSLSSPALSVVGGAALAPPLMCVQATKWEEPYLPRL